MVDVSSAPLAAGVDVLTLRLSAPKPALPPLLVMSFEANGAGVRHVWTSDYTKDAPRLWPDGWDHWRGSSQLASETPLTVAMDGNDTSHLAVACSDAFNRVDFGIVVKERTGDLACRTKEGNYRITGRLKDMIIRGGENIYPKEIEEFIYTHPKVKDVQVIGVPDEQYGEEIMACVILKDGETMTEEEMKAYIRDHMARHKVPRYIDFVTEFPMNVAGKILKYQMRADAIKKLGLQKADSVVTA